MLFYFIFLIGCFVAPEDCYSDNLVKASDISEAISILEETDGSHRVRSLILDVSESGENLFLDQTGKIPNLCFSDTVRIFSSDNLVNSSRDYKYGDRRFIHLEMGETYSVIKDLETWREDTGKTLISEWWLSQLCPGSIEDILGEEYDQSDFEYLVDEIVYQSESDL